MGLFTTNKQQTIDFLHNSTSSEDCGVTPVLESSRTLSTLRFCAPYVPSILLPEANYAGSLIQEFITLERFGPPIKVSVRFSLRAKHVSVKISPKIEAELVLPVKNYSKGHKFLLEKELWVRQKLNALSKQSPGSSETIPIFDKLYLLVHIISPNCKVQMESDAINVHAPTTESYKYKLMKFLSKILLTEITKLADYLSKEHNLKFTKIRIMDNKNKWGSCSSKAVISFNWRLIFAPIEVIKYLVVHEICHIAEMNHSKNFWDLVAKIYPDYQLARLWLKEHGVRLQQYL